MKISKSRLREIVKEVIKEESDYQTFFKKALEKSGKSLGDMSDEEKKDFFNKIDKSWKGKGGKNEGNAFGAAVTKAKEQGKDSFEVDGKTYKVKEGAINERKYGDQTGTKTALLRDTQFKNLVSPKEQKWIKGNDVKIFASTTGRSKLIFTDGKLEMVMSPLRPFELLEPLGRASNEIKKVYQQNESVVNERKVYKQVKVDDDTMVQIVGDRKGFRELTAGLNPKTGKPIQKFGYDKGNEIADSKEELIKKLQKKYGKNIKFESTVNEGFSSGELQMVRRQVSNYAKKYVRGDFDQAINFMRGILDDLERERKKDKK